MGELSAAKVQPVIKSIDKAALHTDPIKTGCWWNWRSQKQEVMRVL